MPQLSRTWLFRPQDWPPSVGPVLAVLVSSLAVSSYLLLVARGSHGVLHAPLLFFALPLILCGVVFGFRGGLVAAAATIALVAYGSHAPPIALAAFAVVIVLLGGGSGLFADERRRTIAEVRRRHALSLDQSRELERALEDAREGGVRLSLVAEAVADGLIAVDVSRTILRFNGSAERMFGRERSEVIGRHEDVLVADPGEESLIDRYLRTGDEGIIGTRHETVCRRKDGSVFPVEFTLGRVSEGGAPVFVSIVRDITERRRHDEAERHFKDILQRTVRERTEELRARTVELDDARVETLRKLALAAEYRDDQTYAHAERVGTTASLLGGLLGLTERETELIRRAAPLHDIGKLAVSDAILLSSEKLTPAQWDQMQSHTTVGHEILSSSISDVLSLAAEIALTHHEWWSGSGYPAGLIGEQIPLCGRLVALADVFDSLCHERPYKAAWTVEEAKAEIHRLSGRQFDPAVVDAFAQLDPHLLAGHPPTKRRGRVTSPRNVRTRSRHAVGPAAGGDHDLGSRTVA